MLWFHPCNKNKKDASPSYMRIPNASPLNPRRFTLLHENPMNAVSITPTSVVAPIEIIQTLFLTKDVRNKLARIFQHLLKPFFP